MAGLALARRDLGRTPRNVFYVDRSLFDHCCVPDVGCKPVGEFGSDVSFYPLEIYGLRRGLLMPNGMAIVD